MKKSLIAFVVTFALSIGFTLMPLVALAELSVVLQSTMAESILVNELISTSFSLVGLAVLFVVFYFLGNRGKILVTKSTIIAVLLGAILGSVTPHLVSILAYNSHLEVYLSLIAGYAVSSVFVFFFPALTALLFAELREKKSNNNLTI